jgi:AraC-like DNA-binding protein
LVSFKHIPKSGDPSDRIQSFEMLNQQVICCRYWWLEKWKSNEMAFPYWRLYWNKNSGAYVYKNKRVDLDPGKLILIPPNTSFSTDLDYSELQAGFDLIGNRVTNKREEEQCLRQRKVLHLFIHFNLGFQLDKLDPEIYSFRINEEQNDLIKAIIAKLLTGTNEFDIHFSLKIYRLILSAISQIPGHKFISSHLDKRIVHVLGYINAHLSLKLSNAMLAKEIHMSTSSFTRFFREHIHDSPQAFIQKLRIDKSCSLLDHSTFSIDAISEQCGFSDRFHFSKIFKKTKGIPPAEYKKRFILNEVK